MKAAALTPVLAPRPPKLLVATQPKLPGAFSVREGEFCLRSASDLPFTGHWNLLVSAELSCDVTQQETFAGEAAATDAKNGLPRRLDPVHLSHAACVMLSLFSLSLIFQVNSALMTEKIAAAM